MKKTLSLIMTAFMLFSLIPVAVMAEETAGETPAEQEYIRYMFDFDTAEGTPVINDQPSQVSIADYNGSNALKVAGDWNPGSFSIELPEAVKTKYALVKIKTTRIVGADEQYYYFDTAPAYKDSNGNESMRLRYAYDRKVRSGHGEQDFGVPQNGVTEEFEAVIDFTAQTVTYGENTKPLYETATDIKSIYFEFGNCNDIIYFDDIEVIGFNDYSAITEPSYEVISIAADGEEVTVLADAKGKTLEISIEKTGDFEVIGAIYDGSKLICADVLDNGIVSLDVPADADTKAYTTKIFAWDSLEVLSPIFDARPIFE